MSIKARLTAAGLSGALALGGSVAYKYEGEVPKVYVDPVGILTACVGHTSPRLALGQHFSKEQCTQFFVKDLRTAQKAVHRCVGTTLPLETEAALISFTFNVGAGNLCSSTLAKLAKQGDLEAACKQLPRWRYAKGKVLPGLITRRHEETALCLRGVYAN